MVRRFYILKKSVCHPMEFRFPILVRMRENFGLMRYIFCCPWQAFWRTPHKPFRQVYHYPCYPSNLPTHTCLLVFMHVFEEAKGTLNSSFSIFRFSAVIFRFSPISSFIQTEVPLHLRLGFFACMHCISMERYFKQFFSCVIFQTFSFIEFFFSFLYGLLNLFMKVSAVRNH